MPLLVCSELDLKAGARTTTLHLMSRHVALLRARVTSRGSGRARGFNKRPSSEGHDSFCWWRRYGCYRDHCGEKVLELHLERSFLF